MSVAAYLRFDEAFEITTLNEFVQRFDLTPNNGSWYTLASGGRVTISLIGAQTTPAIGMIELEELKIIAEEDDHVACACVAKLAAWFWTHTKAWITGDPILAHYIVSGGISGTVTI